MPTKTLDVGFKRKAGKDVAFKCDPSHRKKKSPMTKGQIRKRLGLGKEVSLKDEQIRYFYRQLRRGATFEKAEEQWKKKLKRKARAQDREPLPHSNV